MIETAAFIQRLSRTKNIQAKLANALIEGLRLNRFEAQETFLSPGNHATSIYFVQAGLIRGAIEGPAEKITTWFKQDGDILIPHGLFNQQPSEEYMSAVTNTTLLALPVKHFQKVMETLPEATELLLMLISESLREGQYREQLLRIPAAKDRYAFLSRHENYVLKRIPHYLIASYLNVTKETFSRLHKGLAY